MNVAIARDKLRTPEVMLTMEELAAAALDSAGRDEGAMSKALQQEAQYLALTALGQMEADGEVWMVAPSAPHLADMWRGLGVEAPNTWGVTGPGRVRPTVRLLARDPDTWVVPDSWPNVDELAREAQGAFWGGYAVAAAAAARVAAEQAVEEALRAIADEEEWLGKRAAEREEYLFSQLKPKAFDPLDMSATRAVLSAARAHGNKAAHEGKAPHPGVQALVTTQLPQACTSLRKASG